MEAINLLNKFIFTVVQINICFHSLFDVTIILLTNSIREKLFLIKIIVLIFHELNINMKKSLEMDFTEASEANEWHTHGSFCTFSCLC